MQAGRLLDEWVNDQVKKIDDNKWVFLPSLIFYPYKVYWLLCYWPIHIETQQELLDLSRVWHVFHSLACSIHPYHKSLLASYFALDVYITFRICKVLDSVAAILQGMTMLSGANQCFSDILDVLQYLSFLSYCHHALNKLSACALSNWSRTPHNAFVTFHQRWLQILVISMKLYYQTGTKISHILSRCFEDKVKPVTHYWYLIQRYNDSRIDLQIHDWNVDVSQLY